MESAKALFTFALLIVLAAETSAVPGKAVLKNAQGLITPRVCGRVK